MIRTLPNRRRLIASSAAIAATPLTTRFALLRSARAQDSATLRVVENQFPVSLDANVGFASYSLMSFGIAESLMQATVNLSIEPWLAERLDQIDPFTWRVTMREDARFWDGSPVDAAAVKTSFERAFASNPGPTRALLAEGTELIADGLTLDIRTPEPVGRMETTLAAFYLTVQKVADDGSILYTGPFRYSDFVERTSITLHAVPDYRDGAPASAQIDVRFVQDVTARALALQAGDAHIAHALLPSQIAQLESLGFVVASFPFIRQDDIILNTQRSPFDDVAVRKAISLGIDRELLIEGVMDGVGDPAYGLAPEGIGLEGIVHTQSFDQDQAIQLLDAAGWVVGGDGVREKNSNRLAFNLGYYQSRPELESLAIAIQDQLKEIGIDASPLLDADINTTVAENAFDATLYSYGVAPNGDIDRALLALYSPSGTNTDRYNNPAVNDLIDQYRQASDPTERLALFEQVQLAIGEDVPVVYLINPHQIVGMSSDITGFTPYPLENRKIDTSFGLKG